MTSWVYLFSKFTNEALLLEGLGICILCAGYAAFWVLRKRRMGVIQSAVPSGVVKTYLNTLIFDAEQLRAQLFGLLASTGAQSPQRGESAEFLATSPLAGAISDPDILKKISLLESKMAEQSRAMESIEAEKKRLQKELADAKINSPTSGGNEQVSQLQEKIQSLEGKLAEYSVIEDDLANLKRLQQENAQLKAALAAAPPAAEAEPAPSLDTLMESAPENEVPAPDAAAELLKTKTPDEDAFSNLAGQVEESLKAPEPAPIGETPNSSAAPTAASQPSTSSGSKLDEDLVAEFEKMLNS